MFWSTLTYRHSSIRQPDRKQCGPDPVERSLPVSRVQLALNVDDIDAAVAFYSTLFDAEPAKRRPGYANFAIDDPALKLVLVENPGQTGTLNHLGVERVTRAQVALEADRLEAAGLDRQVESDVVCCHARQEKHWVTGPDGQRWENYVVTDENPEPVAESSCCGATAEVCCS